MQDTGWFYTLRLVVSGLAFGTIFAVLLTATITLAVSALPEPSASADSNGAAQTARVVLIVLASLLPTAPLLEWWYNALRRLFRISFG